MIARHRIDKTKIPKAKRLRENYNPSEFLTKNGSDSTISKLQHCDILVGFHAQSTACRGLVFVHRKLINTQEVTVVAFNVCIYVGRVKKELNVTTGFNEL